MLIATALAAAAIPVAQAGAATWTEIPSGTAEDITAVEYRGGDQFWFTTGNGKIFRSVGGTFQQKYSEAGVVFRDIEFDAAGTIGLAVGTNGRLVRTTNGGDNWAPVVLPNSGDPLSEFTCSAASAPSDLDSVTTDGAGHAWISGKGAQLWRSTGTGGSFGTGWQDAQGVPTADCRVPRDIDTMVFVPASSSGYFIARSFGQVYFTSNGLATSAAAKGAIAGNGFQFQRRAVGDPVNPNRMWTVFPGDGGSYVTRTIDGWNSALDWSFANRDRRELSKPYDVDYAGGTLVTAGDSGLVVLSTNGADFFYEDIPGTLATQDWRAVSLADATRAAIGGTNGKLAVTASANVLPDIVAPTGTISGPTTVPAGQPATYTLNAADEGGSGLNGGSFAWSSAGLPNASGNPVTYTFPSPGFYTVRVGFADNAGNSAQASVSVQVVQAGPTIKPVFTLSGPGNSATAVIVGSKIKVRMRGSITMPPGVNKSAACSGKIRLKLKKGTRTMLNRTTGVKLKNGKCRFAKTVFLDRSKVGRTRTLKLKLRFLGNQVLKAGSISKTLTIRK